MAMFTNFALDGGGLSVFSTHEPKGWG